MLLAQHLANSARIPEAIDRQFLTDLRRAAPLHDIGKVAIPDTILRKPGRLTEAEFITMQNHTRIGAETLRAVIAKGHDTSFLQMAMDIALYHHERFDGRGYPEGLGGDEIPLSARLVCLADSYDAIRTQREYKPARSHGEATAEIRKGSGRQFDPRLVELYCNLREEFKRTYHALAEEQPQAHARPVVSALAAATV